VVFLVYLWNCSDSVVFLVYHSITLCRNCKFQT
jgi:hypothetical protein